MAPPPPLEIYPLIISSELSAFQSAELQNIILISPIHIHAPLVHIGTIHGRMPGEGFQALEISSHFQATTSQVLDYHFMYSQLSHLMKSEVERTFLRRRGQGSDATISWHEFTSGRSTHGGPLWHDLLLGNTSIWGFEPHSIGGYSVVHLAIWRIFSYPETFTVTILQYYIGHDKFSRDNRYSCISILPVSNLLMMDI